MLCAAIYHLADRKLDLLFNEKETPFEQVLQRALSLRPSLVSSQNQPPVRHELPSSWRRPATGVCKLNFDVSVQQSKAAGMDLIVRIKDGEVLAAATVTIGPVMSPLLAEALGTRWALGRATELGFHRIWEEKDYLGLFNCWERRECGFSYLDAVVLDCRLLLLNFDVFNFSFVRRTGNGAAHALARLAFCLGCVIWIEEAPLAFVDYHYHPG